MVQRVVVKLADINADRVLESRPIKKFEEIGLPQSLLTNLYEMGFRIPSKIQENALALLLSNPPRNLVGQSQSGTGKTAAFIINVIVRINKELKKPQAIMLAPSRELATQIYEVFIKMSKNLKIYTSLIVKGTFDEEKSSQNSHVLIGTPGSILNHLKSRSFSHENVSICILDEADTMLDQQSLGSQSMKIKRILPQKCQIVLFSATFPPKLREFAKSFAPEANEISLKEEELAVDAIKQYYVDCRNLDHKFELICNLYALMTIGQSIIFVHRRIDADNISKRMAEEGHKVVSIHGGLSPEERDDIMKGFRQGDTKVLICTNLLSRGIDIPRVNLVINYDMPVDAQNEPDFETYLHRIGRTGRFGKTGASIDFIHSNVSWEIMDEARQKYHMEIYKLDVDDWDEMENLLKNANKQLT